MIHPVVYFSFLLIQILNHLPLFSVLSFPLLKQLLFCSYLRPPICYPLIECRQISLLNRSLTFNIFYEFSLRVQLLLKLISLNLGLDQSLLGLDILVLVFRLEFPQPRLLIVADGFLLVNHLVDGVTLLGEVAFGLVGHGADFSEANLSICLLQFCFESIEELVLVLVEHFHQTDDLQGHLVVLFLVLDCLLDFGRHGAEHS